MRRLIVPIALAAIGCNAAPEPMPTAPAEATPKPARIVPAFGEEILVREEAVLFTSGALEMLPVGTKVRIAGQEDPQGGVNVLVLDGPFAGKSGNVQLSFFGIPVE